MSSAPPPDPRFLRPRALRPGLEIRHLPACLMGICALVLGTAPGCGSPGDEPSGALGAPHPDTAASALEHAPGPVEIRIENLQVRPTLVVGMVDPGNRRYRETGSLPSGYKRVPMDVLQAALRRLDELGFQSASRSVAEIGTADARDTLRRLVVETGDGVRLYVVPRRPSRAAAESFGRMVSPLLDLYNRVESLRFDPDARDLDHFEKENSQLERGRGTTGRSPR